MLFRIILTVFILSIFAYCTHNPNKSSCNSTDLSCEIINELNEMISLNYQLGQSATHRLYDNVITKDSTTLKEFQEGNAILKERLAGLKEYYDKINEPYFGEYINLGEVESYRVGVSHWPSPYTPKGITDKFVRIERKGNTYKLYYKTVMHEKDTLNLVINKSCDMDEANWKTFLRYLNIAKFWMLPTEEFEPLDKKGSKYYVDGYNEYSYGIQGFQADSTIHNEKDVYFKTIQRYYPCESVKAIIDYAFKVAEECQVNQSN